MKNMLSKDWAKHCFNMNEFYSVETLKFIYCDSNKVGVMRDRCFIRIFTTPRKNNLIIYESKRYIKNLTIYCILSNS